MSRPDVALVSPFPPPGAVHAGTSGVASYTANLARALADSGATVHVVAPRQAGAASVQDEGQLTVERSFRLGATAGPAALRAARASGAAVVHIQFELFLFGGASALPGLLGGLGALRRSGRAVVVTMHQVVDPMTVDGEFARLHGVGLPPRVAATALATVQGAVRRAASAVVVHEQLHAGLVPGATVIPHGIERRPAAARDDARRRLGLPAEPLLALCFGFVAPYKGLETASEAAALAGEDVLLAVAGAEHPRHAGYGSRLRERHGDRVLSTGHVPEREVDLWFSAADVVLLPYPRPHASSGALALALAHRRPVLASPALTRSVDASPLLAFHDGASGLARRLRELAASPSARAELTLATERLAAGRSWPEVAARHLELYEEVSGARTARGPIARAA